MLKYTHLYNTDDVTKPYNLCCIESDSANINLYVNDVFKTTLAPNSGTKYSFVVYKAIDVSKEDLVRLLAKGTIEADSYTVAERKSIFNDKNYCYIKVAFDADLSSIEVGSDSLEDIQIININTVYLAAWFRPSGAIGDTDGAFKFSFARTGTYRFTLKSLSAQLLDLVVYKTVASDGRYDWDFKGSRGASNGLVSMDLFLEAGYTYVVSCQGYSGSLSRVDYEFSVIELVNTPAVIPVIDLKFITKYISITNNKLTIGDKATKFYFNPKYFNLPQLYLKLYGAVPSDKDINYNYSDDQQLAMLNSKVISFSSSEYLPVDIDINTFSSSLDNNLFKTSGVRRHKAVNSILSLDSYASYGDKIKLASGTEKLEFTYSPYTTTTYIEPSISNSTTARIFHYPVTFYNPNKKVLFSFPLNKGVNNLAISKTVGSITYNKNLQITRT